MADGATYRDHLLVVERAGGDAAELTAPELPPGGGEIWALFWQLRRSAGSNGMSQNAISFTELLAWQTITGVALAPDEVDLISAMDQAALVAAMEK